jgi:aspartate/methionine/tyrosine aminotransferase
VLTAAEIAAVAELAERHDLWIVFDQVYADLVHVPDFARPHATAAGQARTLVVDSFSKTFGMTGWRLGFLGMPPGTSRAIGRFMQHSVYCVPGFVQAAGLAALSLEGELVPGYRARFRARQTRAAERLDAIPGVSCRPTDAGFYLFPRVDGDDRAVAARWLEELDVATLPGSAFGAAGAGHLRVSVTAPDEDLDEALRRLGTAGLPAAA